MARKGYCEICGKEYAHITQHYTTKRHLKRAQAAENETNDDAGQAATVQTEDPDKYSVGPDGTVRDDDKRTDVSIPADPETGYKNPDQGDQMTTAGIRIYQETTPENKPGGIDRLLDIAFSEQFAPLTITILNGIAERLTPNQNNDVVKPGQFRTENGDIVDRI